MPDPIRQLSAIMFTDMVGYTALMQRDEQRAAAHRAKHRSVFEEQHQRFNGRILQYYGDGTLSVFNSAVEAVECATRMQQLLREGDPIPLRIGLHLGDIVFDGTEVYGDAVNVASRIESLAVGGAVLLSGTLNAELGNKNNINTQSLGAFELKNVVAPVEVFAVDQADLVLPKASELRGKGKPTQTSIAVLPFVNMSPDAANEYFSDGITEEIINALSKIERLKVISRTSSFYFKNQQVPLTEIAERLDVSMILEGSVRVAGQALRIQARLIDVKEDTHFWSETWDRQMDNLFEIQDEISLLIADKLREQGGHFAISDQLMDAPTDNLTAYDHLLKGRFHFNQWNPEDVNLAIDELEQAIALDPGLIDAYVKLADSYSFVAVAGFAPREAAWKKAAEAMDRAKALNPDHPGLNAMLGHQAFFTRADFSAAMRHAKRALAIQPTFAEAQRLVSLLSSLKGDFKQAGQHIRYAQSIDPLNAETRFFEANYYYRLHEFEEAEKILDELLRDNDKNLPAIVVSLNIKIKTGRLAEASRVLEEVPSELLTPQERLGLLTLIRTLETGASNPQLTELEEFAADPTAHHAHSHLFITYANLGWNDKAFEVLQHLFKSQSSILLIGFSDPLAEPIHSDPRYPSYHARVYPKSTDSAPSPKSTPKPANETAARTQVARLTSFMTSEQPFLNPALSLRSLAAQVDIHPNQLSALLNDYVGMNFNQFINKARVAHFKKLVVDPSNSHISLIGLAYESGFNSKTVFNTAFKKETGMTPKAYQKSQA